MGDERSPAGVGSRRLRRRWEGRYARKQGPGFCWFLDRPPPHLVELIEGDSVPAGAALDLGCGPGVATAYLAETFSPAVGLDIAHAALSQAREYSASKGVRPSFVAGAAPILPFRAGSFSIVFDRGCLQAIPREAWPMYFQEIARLLRPGGVLQLLVSKPLKRFPSLLSYRGVRARLRWMLGRRGPQFLSHELLTSLLPASMRVETLEDFPFRTTTGPPRAMTHGIFRKSTDLARTPAP
jgi:SAM-dependent methyltransferase